MSRRQKRRRRAPGRIASAVRWGSLVVGFGLVLVAAWWAWSWSTRAVPKPEMDFGSPTDQAPPPPVAVDPSPEGSVPIPESSDPAGPRGQIALVIDDLGRDVADVDRFEALGVPISYAVLPFEVRTEAVRTALRAADAEVLVHLPMEPANGRDPGPGALVSSMSEGELEAATLEALARIPDAVGVNNHMGSDLTRDPIAMKAVLTAVASEGLFFLDSRTSAETVGYRTARAIGIPAAERHVFLDTDADREAIGEQFSRLLDLARNQGYAIAIGHPYPATLDVLSDRIPEALEAGFTFVPVSFLLERSAAPSP